MLGQAVRCGDEKVSAAARRVAYLQAQDDLGSVGLLQGLSYDRFEELYFQNPEFGLSFLKLTSRRLFQNIARLEQELVVRNSPSLAPR